MEKSVDCDSDASLSWEEFFGSSTDLVPTLLSMYDSLITQSLSENRLGSNQETPDPLRWGTLNTQPLTTADVKEENSPGWTTGKSDKNGHPPKTIMLSSRNGAVNQRYGVSNRTRWSLREKDSAKKESQSEKGENVEKDKGLIQRPLSVNSTLSTTSSSCSSESSSSHSSNVPGLAPRASPEEEDASVPIPHVDLSDDEDLPNECAKNDQMNNSTDCSFSSPLRNDCEENGNRRISYPISNQSRPKFCDPNMSYMDRVVMEIVETERIYVNDLREIIFGYLDYWRDEHDEPLPLVEIKELFSNIEEIHQFNSEFLTQLEGCGLNPVDVARCFVTKNKGFSVYTEYCTNYPRTMCILTELMRQERESKIFRERQACLGHTLPLGSYLLKPVQRILKYHLLLQNIVKHYEAGAEGYDSIVEALSAMTNIAHHINDMKRRHEHAVRVQEIQSLLYGWQGEDLTTYGELCAEGTFRVYGAKALRHVFLFDKMLLITKKKEDGILSYKSHIMCSNLMLIESVPGEPLSFHVIPFDNPRLQCTLQARNLEQKREWTLQLKREILENYHAVIPSHARQLVMELGQYRQEDETVPEKAVTKRQHSAPEYLERRKQEKDRRKSESTLKARLRKTRKGDPKESLGAFRRSRRTSPGRDRSESTDREITIAIDRKMSSASCPPSGSEKRLVKKLSGWRRKSEPGIYHHYDGMKEEGDEMALGSCGSIIGEEEGGETSSVTTEDSSTTSQIDLSHPETQDDLPNAEERRESIEEIVGQLVMQNRDFQRILSKQRLVHLRRALAQHQQRHLHEEEESASETETEDHHTHRNPSSSPSRSNEKGILQDLSSGSSKNDSSGSQVSSSNGIGSGMSDVNENSSENVSIEPNDNDNILLCSKNVQRTVSDPGNKMTLTPRRFISGPFSQYDPLSLLWSSFRRNETRGNGDRNGNSNNVNIAKGKGRTSIRHTHSFTCSHKNENPIESLDEGKEILQLPHGDSGVFPNSFTSDSSSSSEANIPTLPAVWLKKQDEHLATPNNKSGSLPRSFQPGQVTLPPPVPSSGDKTRDETGYKSRLREPGIIGKYPERPFTIASDKPSPSDISYDEMEQYVSKFNDELKIGRNSTTSLTTTEGDDMDDLTTTELTPVTSMDNLNLHPDHKIYRSSKSSIKHILMSVTARLSGLKMKGGIRGGSSSTNFGSFPNITSNPESPSRKPTQTGNKNAQQGRNGMKSLKKKIKHIVKEDRDNSDSENCESVTCSSTGSSGFGSLGSNGSSSNNLTSKIGARLAHCSEQSDYSLTKLLGSALNESLMREKRPHSVLSISSNETTTSSSNSEDKGQDESQIPPKGFYRNHGRKGVKNQRDLYLSYIDQEADALSDSDASADSFYERSFEAIESLLDNEIFPDSAIYSDMDESGSANSSSFGGERSRWENCIDSHPNCTGLMNGPPPVPMKPGIGPISSLDEINRKMTKMVRSQAILEKLKHLQECSQRTREVTELQSPCFDGIKTIQERRRELDLWKNHREDESETSSQHSTSTINTVIELSPNKSTSLGSSRRCSDTDSSVSGGNSPQTERAISRSSNGHSVSQGNLDDPMPKGWVKLVVGKLEGEP